MRCFYWAFSKILFFAVSTSNTAASTRGLALEWTKEQKKNAVILKRQAIVVGLPSAPWSLLCCQLHLLLRFHFSGSGWQEQIYQQQDGHSMPKIGKYPERQFGNDAAVEHGKKLRHQSKSPDYFKQVGVTLHGVRGSGNPFIDPDLSTTNQSVVVGKQIIMRCHIEDAGNKSVSSNFFSFSQRPNLLMDLEY